eukprot:Rhum_TRINITY_DN20956_c0_g1::Rhum_TRINITY_DN20956_c0_g1_i1::g.172686::m.172686
MKCGDVHQVMRRKPAHGDAAHGRSKTWRACFCLNVNVFHYLSEHAEDIEWQQLSRAVAPTPKAAEFVVGKLRKEQTPSDGQWVLGHWVVFRAGTAVVAPLSEYRFSQVCLYGHKKMLWVLTIYARIRSEQAWISTLGGGFASVRNVPKAIEYAVKLFYCACLLHDEDLKSKSRLFVGWNMLFLGNKKRARAIFLDEIVDAKNRHDEVGVQRGYGAMNHLRNPRFSEAKSDVVPPNELQWARVFSDDHAQETQKIREEAGSEGFEISGLSPTDS